MGSSPFRLIDPIMLERIGNILRAAAKEFFVDSGFRQSAALSYYSLFSLVPLLFIAVAVAGFVYGDAAAVQDVVDRAAEVAGTQVGDALEMLLTTVQQQRGNTLSIGIALSAFTAASVFQQVQAVLGAIFHVPEEKRRTGAMGWIIRRLIGVASAVVLAVLALTPVAAVAGMSWLIGLLPESAAWSSSVLQVGIPLAAVTMLLFVTGLTFQVLTSIEIPWKAAMRGGAVTALIGLASAFLVGVYLSTAGATGTLGALGGVAILLFFFNLMWAVYLFGAEVTKVYVDYLRFGDVVAPSERGDDIAPPLAHQPHITETKSTRSFALGAAIGWLIGRRR